MSVLLHVEARAKVDHRGPDGITALLGACKNGHQEVVTALVKYGATTDVEDDERMDCIATALAHNQDGVVDFLSSLEKTPRS